MRFDTFLAGALAVAVWRGTPLRPRGARDWAAIASYGGLSVILHNLGLMAGSAHVPVALVAMATGLSPLLTLVLARAFVPGVRLDATTIVGILAGLAGVALLASRGGVDGGAVSGTWTAVVLGAVLAWSAGSVGIKASGTLLSPLALAVWGSLAGALVLQPLALAFEPVPGFDAAYMATVLFAGLVGGLAAFLVWGGIVHEHGPQRANLASYVSPVVASLAAWAFVGQPIGTVHVAAYVLVAAGLTVALLPKGKPQPPAAVPPE